MMVNPYDDSRLMLALQIDHSRVAGFLAAHWETQILRDLSRTRPWYWQLTSTTHRLVGMGNEAFNSQR